VLGTARLAKVAVGRGVDRFVMISSDKAVRPTSMMGATKRIAERVISELAPNGTTFVSVRFGNVLESSGSVVPLFKRQIAAGGPVTVTSPKVRRYFMTVSEAVDLVLVAGTVGLNGEIMVLEMGELIKVCDLARRLIKLSGLIPDKDIKIEYTGLRPGEKEYEEVMTDDEDVVRTSIDKIWVMKGVRNAERGTRNAEGGEKKRSFGQDQQDQQDKRRRNHGGTEGEVVNGRRNVDLGRIEDLVLKNDVKGLWEVAGECVPENEFAKRE
jgi:FlaA1/EpsC-like NDP-sugar epimerase